MVDHSHLSGRINGVCHSQCNLMYQESQIIPVIIHNSNAYDTRHIIRKLSSAFEGDISVIANTDQNYISYTKTVQNSMEGESDSTKRMRK